MNLTAQGKLIWACTERYADDSVRMASHIQYILKQSQAWANRIVFLADPNDPKHGKDSGYSAGCRCDKCKKAHSEAAREYRKVGKSD